MKTLIFCGKEYQAERIVKTVNSVTGYIGDAIVFEMRGISDFKDYVFPDGVESDSARAEILARLATLDAKAIRSLRAIMLGVGDDKDNKKLVELENEAVKLRAEMQELKA